MALTGSADLLERAVCYGLESVKAVTTGSLPRPTPCADWDLHALLRHVNDSIEVLGQGIDSGSVGLFPDEAEDGYGHADGDSAAALVATFQDGTRRLMRAWTAAEHDGHLVAIAGHPMAAELMAIISAVEIAVHGWDVSMACGRQRPIPAALAIDLLTLSPLVVHDGMRHPMFAAPVPVPPLASPSDRLVAFLGRSPGA
ncbi:TIGR03086 family metal-binding protein [Nonomuraea sp. 3-1Str]|uniref:TIGR03086 family metal-binding protein n=1 Tax=Nonomuraea sp. 3-1Str TaxID=2929801 RepID=UPI0028648F06|nr:TIGR03086 family metal-binding protein [Nonomuraea sp. 3-1Str]MDR8413691.1 TIGR03086 family metal-binding protein [Nonomuraea sp. 3-1Str]